MCRPVGSYKRVSVLTDNAISVVCFVTQVGTTKISSYIRSHRFTSKQEQYRDPSIHWRKKQRRAWAVFILLS